jgi:hypothetical protein
LRNGTAPLYRDYEEKQAELEVALLSSRDAVFTSSGAINFANALQQCRRKRKGEAW